LLSRANKSIESLDQRALLIDQPLRIADNIDKQHVSDLKVRSGVAHVIWLVRPGAAGKFRLPDDLRWY
jgi:hypothetical protein